jgi:hypothetical protein
VKLPIIAAVLIASTAARAEPTVLRDAAKPAKSAEPTQVFATQPLALIARGVSASYEHRIARRFSALVLVGYRAAALGDYSSTTLSTGAELRLWLRPSTAMRGPYLGAHASVGTTRLSDDVMGHIGSSTGLAQRLDVGWRFTIRRHVAITPSVGLGYREDIDASGRLATTARPMIAFGLEVGWIR